MKISKKCDTFQPPKGHMDSQMYPECEGTKYDRDVVKKEEKKRKKKKKKTKTAGTGIVDDRQVDDLKQTVVSIVSMHEQGQITPQQLSIQIGNIKIKLEQMFSQPMTQRVKDKLKQVVGLFYRVSPEVVRNAKSTSIVKMGGTIGGTGIVGYSHKGKIYVHLMGALVGSYEGGPEPDTIETITEHFQKFRKDCTILDVKLIPGQPTASAINTFQDSLKDKVGVIAKKTFNLRQYRKASLTPKDREDCPKKSTCPSCGSKEATMLNCGKGSCNCGHEWEM